MRTLLAGVMGGLSLLSAVASAQVDIVVGPPTVRFEAPPPLVEVSPGVQVVPEQEQEVYVADGFYWVHHGKHWFRAEDHRGAWVMVDDEYVPVTVYKAPKGKYKHYKPGKAKDVVLVAPDGEIVKYKFKKEKHKKEKH